MGLFDKIKDIMTIPDEDEVEETPVEETPAPKRTEEPAYPSHRETPPPRIVRGKGTGSEGASAAMQVVLVKPDRFEDVTSIADHLNNRKTVVLNLEAANRDVSRRIVDFLSGAAYANHGNMRKVANSTFIIAANGVDVMGELMLEDFDENKLYF